jgi:DNA-binding XRE family transcriptional regulator
VPSRQSPTARHRRLIVELNRLRKESGLSRDEVAQRIGASDTSVFRWEKGLSRPKPTDVAALLRVYEVGGPPGDELLDMAKDARKRGWWHRHRQTLKPGFDSYIGLEAAAAAVRTYASQIVPGLLQTEAYARAIIEAIAMTNAPATVDDKVAVRLSRQELVTRRSDSIRVVAVLDEAVLRRQVGGPELMRAQLRHLVEVSALPNVVLHVVPFAAGAHCAMDGSFYLLQFPEPGDPDVAYLEQATSGLVPDDAGALRRYTLMFGTLLGSALSPEESVAFISGIAHE